MITDSEDEFGDGQSFEYNEAFETQLQIIESRLPDDALSRHPVTSDSLITNGDRASTTRRKLEHLDISLGDDFADDEAVDDLIGEDDQVVLDVLNAPASQSSKYEEELVQQVTELIPGASRQIELAPDPAADVLSTSELEREEQGGQAGKKNLFQKFRKRGFFSVTDLVAPSWCEVQFDYRLRSKSYLPVAARPDTITTSTGTVISVNKQVAGTGEKIMRKGEQVHKKLEREIHPVEVKVQTESREDVWGLRQVVQFLNMLASLEALLSLGKCRELPVVGFIRGYMVVGVIDEITRLPLVSYAKKKHLILSPASSEAVQKEQPSPKKSSKKAKVPSSFKPSPTTASAGQEKPSPQKTLFAFYRPLLSKPKASPKVSHERTHMVYVSDSKTRAGGTMPKEENSVNGKMQLMLYKEMLDGMIVEGLRQHAMEQAVQQQAQAEAEDDIEIIETEKDDDVVFVDYNESREAGTPYGSFNGLQADPSSRQERSNQVNGSPKTPTVDRFTWRELFEHLSLDPKQPFTDTFVEQSRLLVQGNNLSTSVACAENLQQMTSCWAEYVSKLGLGTVDPTQSPAQIEDALEKETGGRRIGRSEKLLTLVYRRVGKSKKKKSKGRRPQQNDTNDGPNQRSRSGKRRKHESSMPREDHPVAMPAPADSSPPREDDDVPATDMEAENERTLQLAIAESLVGPSSGLPKTRQGDPADTVYAARMDNDEEPLPESLVPPEVFQAMQERHVQHLPHGHSEDVQRNLEKEGGNPSNGSQVAKTEEDLDGSIIGSHRFAYSPALLSEHIDKVLQFWTGTREPHGVSIENTTRCGWCEFEDGCEWRAAKSLEAANRNEGLLSTRRPARPQCQ